MKQKNGSTHERLEFLEKEVVELRKILEKNLENTPQENWIEKISGSMKDFPEFGEVIRLGEEFRKNEGNLP